MITLTLEPFPTDPCLALAARESAYLAPIQALATQLRTGETATSILCQAPLGRLAVMTHSKISSAHVDQLHLLPEGIRADDALDCQASGFAAWTTLHSLPEPTSVGPGHYLVAAALGSISIRTTWALCDFGDATPADFEVHVCSKTADAETAALALTAAPGHTLSKVGHAVSQAFHDGVIEFTPGRTPCLRAVDALAEVLGELAEHMPEGARDIGQYLSERRLLPLQENLTDLLRVLPANALQPRQAVIDQVFRRALTIEQRKAALRSDDVYEGALPPRYPLAHMVGQLMIPCIDSFIGWALPN